ncbi:MAG: single-stranded-DNA-specific exonuclease RecJ [Abditibacteriota bacterium]|nr:single-stranded-DNA-specific exonuclease RecJ [Abditibacteriota bacterium]
MNYTVKPFPDRESVRALAGEAGISEITAALLLQRGVATGEQAKEFFEPGLAGDPLLLPDIDKAADILMEARSRRLPVMVFGDYDVDGMTTTSLLCNSLTSLGFSVSCMLPDRLNAGYDITPDNAREIAEKGFKVLLTCDCGTRANEAVETAKELGLKVIVTDHHQVPEDPAPADALVNPHRSDSAYPYPYLCGAGVAYRAVHALLLRMGVKPDTFLSKYLDLVCLATVADSVPLTGENRFLVRKGLPLLKNPLSKRIGIKTLIENSKPEDVTCRYLSFFIIPVLNSASRMGEAEAAFSLLTETDPRRVLEKLDHLNRLNNQRKADEEKGFGAASLEIYREGRDRDGVIVVSGDWLHSIAGNIASRLAKTFNRPAIAIGRPLENGLRIGSARNNNSVDILELITCCSELLEKFGGHRKAGGITIREENIPLFRQRINEAYVSRYRDQGPAPACEVDLALSRQCFGEGFALSLCREISRREPFGEENREPVFITKRVRLNGAEAFGKGSKHLRLELGEPPFGIEGIFWNRGSDANALQKGMLLDVIYRLELHRFRDIRPRLLLEDYAIST